MRPNSPNRQRSARLLPSLRPIAIAISLAVGLPAATTVAQAQTTSAVQRFDLPAGALDATLTAIARQSGRVIVVDPELVKGLQAAPVKGELTVEQAFARALSGSGLELTEREGGTLGVRRVPATLKAVKVEAAGLQGSELPETYAGGQVARGGRVGLLGNRDAMDTPFSVTSYTAQTIEDQAARTVADVLRNDASVRASTPDGHPFENFRIRNFAVNQNEMTIDGLYGLAPYGHTPVEMFERVELLRGPSALFVGMAPAGALGGTINLVPKRAGETPLNRVSLDYIGESQFGTRVDVARRFGPDDAIGARINGAFSDGDTELDGQSKQRQFLSLALDYRNDGFRGSLDAYYSKEKFDGGTPAGIFFRSVPSVLKAPDGSSNQFPAAYGEAENKAAIARVEYAFNDAVTAFANVAVRNGEVAGFFTGTWVTPTSASGAGSVSLSGQRMYEDNVNTEAGLRLNFDTAVVQHELTLQASRLEMDYGYAANSNGGVTNMYDPSSVAMPTLPRSALKWSDKTFDSLALVDTLSMLDDRLLLTLGLRHQSFEVEPTAAGTTTGGEVAYDKSVVTPAAGVVFKPWGPDVALYASYVQGLSQGGSILTTSGYVRNHTFAPYETEQTEAGVKWNAGTFTNTLALYQITKPELISFAVAGGMDATDDGEKRVRGLEWNTFGEIAGGVRVLGGVVYAQSIQNKTQGGQFDGDAAVGSPRWQANLGAEWDVPGATGLTLTSRVQASSRQWLTNNHSHEIPGWGVLDLGARYATRLSGRDAVLRLNVANVTDRDYYSGIFREGAAIATIGAPRTVSASVTVDF